jgi:type I restriction enzyme S subunit
MSLPRYPKYKDSGVEWLGEVPEHWQVIPLKRLAEFINGDAFKPTEWAESGTPIIRIQNLNGSEEFNYFDGDVEPRYLVHAGDLLFGWSGNRGTSFGPFLWRRNEVCALNQHIFRVVPTSISKQSLYWTLKAVTVHVEDQAHGIIGMVHITKGDLGAINVPIPPDQEHQRLASFLDQETAKIDALVEEQQRLIELLKEKRQAVISHVVTKGLNPDALMKDSGTESLGEVPRHWTRTRLRFLFRQEKRQDQSEKPVLSVYRDYGVILKDSRDDNMNKTPEDLSAYQLVNPGDLVINKMKAWQGSLGVSVFEGITSPDYIVFTPHHQESPDFLHLLLRSRSMVSIYRGISNGIRLAQWRLEPDSFLALGVFLPPMQEQRELVSFVADESLRFDALIAEATRAIDLLEERRTALISAAVTGKLDVRGVATEEAA